MSNVKFYFDIFFYHYDFKRHNYFDVLTNILKHMQKAPVFILNSSMLFDFTFKVNLC